MADLFPTALQRTSDERWVTLQVVARDGDRAVARVAEAPEQNAVVRASAGEAYDAHLRRLIASPPPDAGRHVHLAWPVDLLHDLDGTVVGYTSLRPSTTSSVPLADFADPVRRTEVAPLTTRHHVLRVARNVATATAALHYAGHGRIRGGQFRVDPEGDVVVVRIDELASAAGAAIRQDDEVRLGHLMVRLLSGQPWAAHGELADLLARASGARRDAPPAQAWFFALREAERALPAAHIAAGRSDPPADRAGGVGGAATRAPVGTTDLATALRAARQQRAAADAHAGSPTAPVRASSVRTTPAPATPMQATPVAAGGSVTTRCSTAAPAIAAPSAGATATRAPAPVHGAERPGRVDGRRPHAAVADALPPAGPARAAFAVASGLTVGVVASVAPFVAFLAAALAMVVGWAVGVGRRKTTRGPHQMLAIVVSRLVPFATGGLALGAFILLDLLLLLGLCMALASAMFGYGPGFTLTWILQLPEVPGLVRAFSFVVGASGGLALGARGYDRIRAGAGTRRALVAPALALALAAGVLLADAAILWWPIPASA
jgi:hypothetical protein